MENKEYRALVVEETVKKTFTRSIKERTTGDLPAGDLLVRVKYSSLNYKDALSATGNRGVTRTYPHTPGIDVAGIVEESADSRFASGDEVIVTGYDLGMNTSGGFGQYIRVPAGWVVKLPQNLNLKESMILGTAGFTAALSVDALLGTKIPEDGEVLVTGATGGVGSVAVAILSRLGFTVAAVSGKVDAGDFLASLGAAEIIPRAEMLEQADRPLLKTRWAGAVDTVGGTILAGAIKSAKLLGVVTCCGNAASAELPITVYPFILRGVSLIGIDSQNCPMAKRTRVWGKLAKEWKIPQLNDLYREIPLAEVSKYIDIILKGGISGRVVVNLDL